MPWQKLTLADVFPGPAQTLQNISKEAVDLNTKIDSVANQLLTKVNALQGIIGTTTNLLNGITNTGVYVLYLEPNSGNLVDRINTETGAPTGNYSAGIVLGISSVDLATAVEQYQNLTNILTSPIQIPK